MTEVAQATEVSLEDQLAQQLCSYHLNTAELARSTKPIRFIMGKAGAYRAISNPIGLFVAKASSVPGLPLYAEGLTLSIPKVPYDMFLNTIAFFKEVMVQHSGAEAMVQFYWDASIREWFMACPDQTVSGASVHFDRNQDLDRDYLLVMDIHSHNTMGAFWSGTDTADEKETRVYGVFGNLNRPMFSYKFRISVGGDHKDIKIEEIFSIPEGTILTVPPEETGTFPVAWLDKCKSAPPVVYPVVPYRPYKPYKPYDRTKEGKWGNTKYDIESGEFYTEMPGDRYDNYWGYGYEEGYQTMAEWREEQALKDKLRKEARIAAYLAKNPGNIRLVDQDARPSVEDVMDAAWVEAAYAETGSDDETIGAMVEITDIVMTWTPAERKIALEALVEAYIDEVAVAVDDTFGAYDEITSIIMQRGYTK